jgi:hypothetical protein
MSVTERRKYLAMRSERRFNQEFRHPVVQELISEESGPARVAKTEKELQGSASQYRRNGRLSGCGDFLVSPASGGC